ncbi:arginine 3rd transport system periplasmic binding protein [Legionella lansingensis]|uniref:Arginine 3rd transport system periplasmic binding protein n=2 Tax=Legionella lansingensis TaxID=45067 RepID=A0A0W0VEC3_9GAMM|nr:arginine 3rd transport system periplasmic binding protein [Legionella lansingensis]SNV50157.1 arginine 3rd transport system periplasmic binding protein [Legionella lansingensis]
MKSWRILLAILLLETNFASANIVVGNISFKPPFVTQEGGFDIDLMLIICSRLNETCQFKPMMFPDLFDALQEKKIDLAIGGITISPIRETEYIFSYPYAVCRGQFLLLEEYGIHSIEELFGSKIGVIRGTSLEDFLVHKFGDKFTLALFDSPMEVIAALNNKEIKAAFLDQPLAVYWDQHDGGKFILIGNPFLVGEGYGVMALPENAELIEKINKVLLEIERDGTYLQLYSTYFE